MNYAAKLILFLVTAVLGSNVAAALVIGDWTNPTVLWGLGITLAGSLAMFLKANTPEQPNAKKVVGILTVVLLAVVDAATDHRFSPDEIVQILLVLVGALGVGPNGIRNVGDAHHAAVGKTA